MPLGTLLVICLAAKERVIPRMACLQCTLWLPECSCFCGHGRRTSRSWSDEGKQDNGAISRALLVMHLVTCPSSSPSFRTRGLSTSPAQTLPHASFPGLAVALTQSSLPVLRNTHTHTPTLAFLAFHLPPARVSELPSSPFLLLLVDCI